ncbi:MAG: FtsX-like permease family protein [Pseudomonadota bacterium]
MILALAALRYHRRQPWQAVLAVLGVALGVAVVVAVELANNSAERAFTRSAEALTGAATHRVVAGSTGVDEAIYAELRRNGFRASAPVVKGHVVHDERPLQVLGIDPWAEGRVRGTVTGATRAPGPGAWLTHPGLVVLLAGEAERMGLAVGDALPVTTGGRAHDLTIAALAEPPDALTAEGLRDTLLVDIATAQGLFHAVGRLSHIDLVAPEGTERADWLAAVADHLPPEARIVPAESGAAAMAEMTRAFRLNLTAFSLLSLLVGALLIYNAVSFSVVQRRPLLGRLRAIGVDRFRLFRGVIAEGALIGAIGTLIGLPLGWLLADGLLVLVTRTIADLYFVISVRDVAPSMLALLWAVLLGVGVASLAAAAPAWEAAAVAPRTALSQAPFEQRARTRAGPAALVGLLVIAAGGGLLSLDGGLITGFIGITALLVGTALGVPWAVRLLARAVVRPAGALFGTPARMAARGVATGLSRSAVAAIALVIAITAVIGVGVMIDSFRTSLATWLDSTLAADVYVGTPTVTGGEPTPLPPGLAERFTAVDGVESVIASRYRRVGWDGGEARLRAVDTHADSRDGFRVKAAEPEAWARLSTGDAVWITEPFAAHHDLAPGDTLTLRTPSGQRSLPVAAVTYDYRTSQGAIYVARSFDSAQWGEHSIHSLAIHADGREPDHLLADLRAAAGTDAEVLRFRTDATIRELSLTIFDQTFTITHVLRLLAAIVAAAGVFGALLALSLERGREVAVLRALGMTPGQVWTLELTRTGLLGLLAGMLAWAPGLALAAALTRVINARAFGWSLPLHVDPLVLVQALGLAMGAALLAGIYPAWRAARVVPGEALRDD